MHDLKLRGYTDGYLERKSGGRYEGKIKIDGVDLSPIEGVYFKDKGNQYLWIKRKPMLEWNFERNEYVTRQRFPIWEAYLQHRSDSSISYKGDFTFLRFRYSIVGIWDKQTDASKNRINFFIERLPHNQQTIINGINERNKALHKTKRDAEKR